MSDARNAKGPSHALLRNLVLAGLIGALFGAVQYLRGPVSTHPLPDMADVPVVMPDGRAVFVQRHEVTVAEWNACHHGAGCTLLLRTRSGLDPATTPDTGLSHVDASEYVAWINGHTGHNFRLPTAAEWNHMAESVLPEKPEPLFTDPALTWASAYLIKGQAPRALRRQGSFSVSPEGIVDLDGSVWEWTQDC